MKNIIIFFPSFERGGAEKILINIIKNLSQKNIKVFLITNSGKKEFGFKNIKIIKIPNLSIPFLNNRIVSGMLAIKYLINLLIKLNIKDTKVLSMQSNFFSVLICYFFNFKVSVRISEDPCGATYFADNRFFSFFIMITKFITYNFSDGIIANGKKSMLCVQQMVFNKSKVKLLYNPYLLKLNLIKKRKTHKYFLNVGRLCKQKNQTCLIDAFSLFKNSNKKFKLIFIGDGPDKSKLINQVNKLNLQSYVIFKGWKKNLNKFYSKAYAFVLPSLYEGMPNALIDAINYEIPSISSNASGVNELLLYGKGGEIIQNINKNSLSKRMIFMVNNYKHSQKKIIKSKKQLNKFLINFATEKYINFLNKF